SEVDATSASTIVVNPTRADRGGLVQAYEIGSGPLHYVSEDGDTVPAQVLRTIEGEGFATVVTGQKVRWVLELMRGPEFAGARIAKVVSRQVGDDDWEYTFVAAAPGEP